MACAEIFRSPRLEGRHAQFTVKLDALPLAVRFLHPGITFPLTQNVIFEETVTFAVIII